MSKSKCTKTHHVRTIFGGSDVEKVHAVVARSTFRSQNVQNTPCTDHFWRFRCRKSARRCGAKHISKSKCNKTHHVRTIFGGSDVVSRGRRKGLWTVSKVSKTWGFCSIFNHNHHYTTLHDTPIHYTTLQLQRQLHLHYILLHSTTLHRTQLHSTTLHYTTLPSITLHHATLHSTTHYTSLHYTTTTTAQLHSATLHYTPLHYTATLNYTTLHYTTLHDTPLHCTTLHYTTLPYTEWHCTTDRQVDR